MADHDWCEKCGANIGTGGAALDECPVCGGSPAAAPWHDDWGCRLCGEESPDDECEDPDCPYLDQRFPKKDWIEDVVNRRTLLGYHQWQQKKLEEKFRRPKTAQEISQNIIEKFLGKKRDH